MSVTAPAPKSALFLEGLDLKQQDEPGNAADPPDLAADQSRHQSRNL